MRRTAALVFLFFCLSGPARAEIATKPGQVNPYQTRSELLMQAMERVGVSTPRQAAAVWAEGLRMRSAALQYAAMTTELRQAYAAQLDALESNWVTGMSSPSVGRYAIGKVTRRGGGAALEIRFTLESSYGEPAYCNARLTLVREGGFWRVSTIEADEVLYPYTLYRPAEESPRIASSTSAARNSYPAGLKCTPSSSM